MTRRNDQHRPESRDIYLDDRSSYKVTVTPEGYQKILDMIRASAVCEDCKQLYDEESKPNVAGLLCLTCFLRQHSGFTFIGPLDPDWYTDRYRSSSPLYEKKPTYLFLDQDGYAHLTDGGPGTNKDARKSVALTLKYWHFPRPEQAEWNGQTVKIGEYNWSVYGNVRIDDVVMLQHGSTWNKDETLFVARRGGRAIQINRRKPMHRQLFTDAKAELEATRTPGGMYLIDGEYQSYIHESDVYRSVARRVGEAMNAARAESGEPQRSEPETTEPQADEDTSQEE